MLALVAMRRPLGERWQLYVLSILLASGSEALLVHLLGASAALAEAARGVSASLVLVLLLDVAALLCGRMRGWRASALAAVAGLALMLVPGPITLFERIALRAEPASRSDRPPLALLTGLPLVWGEGGVEGALGGPGPAAAYSLLADAYAVSVIDAVTAEALAGTKLLLVAQPHPPGPAGLVAIDEWVRSGGRALILTDPALRWPSDLAFGDPRRPPLYDGLGPLLTHWGLALEPPQPGPELVTREVDRRRLVMAAPGRFVASGANCSTEERGLLADCRLGRGHALLIADADLLHDLLWVGPGEIGTTRAGRLADNAAFLFRKLDELQARAASSADWVDWISRRESYNVALLAAFAAPMLLLLSGLTLLTSGRRASSKKEIDRLIHRAQEKTKPEQ